VAVQRKQSRDSKYFQKVHVTSIARVVVVGKAVQFANAVWRRALISVLNVEFPCEKNWSEKSEHTNIFTADKIKRLQEMKAIGVEEWIKKQWE